MSSSVMKNIPIRLLEKKLILKERERKIGLCKREKSNFRLKDNFPKLEKTWLTAAIRLFRGALKKRQKLVFWTNQARGGRGVRGLTESQLFGKICQN